MYYRHWEPVGPRLEPHWTVDHINFTFYGFQIYHCVVPDANGWTSQLKLILPIWLFLPAGIPPFLWWRKWKKARGGRGFPVEAISPAPPTAPETAKNL